MVTERRCSFCGKKQGEVARLIAGPTVYICNECVVLCMDILDEDPAGIVPATDGQLLVRFPDGTVHTCEQHHAWQAFTQDGESLDWCAAAGCVRSLTPLAVLAVRRHGAPARSWGRRSRTAPRSPRLTREECSPASAARLD